MFQSSPNPKVGRYQLAKVKALLTNMFQSSPNPKVGRYKVLRQVKRVEGAVFQSSPNPKVGRYCPEVAKAEQQPHSFNPRPTRRSGATGLVGRKNARWRDVFQSSPNPKVGRYARSPERSNSC